MFLLEALKTFLFVPTLLLMWLKVKIYTTSLVLLFLLLFFNKISIPVCYGEGCHFIGKEMLINVLIQNWIAWVFLLLFLLCIFFYQNLSYRVVRASSSLPEKVTFIENKNFENLGFFSTYIVPLLCFDLDFNLNENRNFLMLILVLLLIGWIYIKTNIFYTNPALSILNFNLYKINTAERKDAIVIIRGKLDVDDSVRLVYIDESIFFAKKF